MTLSLIPRDQPQGDRQTNVAAAQEAGLQTKISQKPPADFAMPPQPMRQATPRQSGEFDALESRTPQGFGQLRQSQDSRVLDVIATSNNPILRDLSERLRGF